MSDYHETNKLIQAPRRPEVIGGVYDFDVDGGAVGDIKIDCWLPALSMATNGWIRKITAATSGGSATIALKFSTSGDVLAATAYDNEKFAQATADVAKTLQTGSATGAIVNEDVDDALQLIATIAGAALTAGKYEFGFEVFPLSNK